jgi:hypothetical protein
MGYHVLEHHGVDCLMSRTSLYDVSSLNPLLRSFKSVHADECQGDIGGLCPYNFTRIFANELSNHANIAIITNFKSQRRGVEIHKSAAKRDILDRGYVIQITQTHETSLIAIDPFVMPVFCHGTPRL